jgi:hypothetical protein
MSYEIDQSALVAFVERQIATIMATEMPPDIAAVVSDSSLSREDLQAVWLGAGIATQIGLALLEYPDQFVRGLGERDAEGGATGREAA